MTREIDIPASQRILRCSNENCADCYACCLVECIAGSSMFSLAVGASSPSHSSTHCPIGMCVRAWLHLHRCVGLIDCSTLADGGLSSEPKNRRQLARVVSFRRSDASRCKDVQTNTFQKVDQRTTNKDRLRLVDAVDKLSEWAQGHPQRPS
ncbi:unnamed protein product [Sympodiomycopsis kandeliae]